jgi:hypothetical protein
VNHRYDLTYAEAVGDLGAHAVTADDWDRLEGWLRDARATWSRGGSDARVCELLDAVSFLAAQMERDTRALMHPITAALEGRASWADVRDGTFVDREDRVRDVAHIRELIARARKEQL